jgi:Catalytic LigB subunit of aromatic ring-opening dioxygenase
MARITAGVATSHVPAIGAAIDLGKTQQPYWAPVFAGYEFSKRWIAANRPDVVFLVPSAAPSSSRRPTRVGVRAQCRRFRVTRSWRRILRNR